MKKFIITLFSIVLIGTGCETIDFGDVNKNVNGPAEASTSALLSGAITGFATRTGRPYRITPTLNVQWLMQHVYNDEMLYADIAGYWQSYYVQTTSNLAEVIKICSADDAASDPKILAGGAVENQIAVSMIFKAVIFKRTTDLFGDIPYSEALNPEILLPAYDPQEDIYKSMIADVKAARDMIDVAADGPTGDVIYGGDMEKWQKFANSFLLSLSMQLTKRYPLATEYAATEFVSALNNAAGVIETMDEEAWYTFDIDNAFNNPWNWMRPADYGVTYEFISSLKGTGTTTSNTTYDNRLELFVTDPANPGLPYGYIEYANTTDNSPIAGAIYNPATQLPLLTAAYTYLNRAEAAARGWTTEVVATMLTNGIEASYATGAALYDPEDDLGIGDGAAYAAARVADIATATGGALQVIGEEKWVALFPLGYDAWAEWRRTEYPTLVPATDALNSGVIPRRYNYPTTEATLNPAGYAEGVAALSPATDNNSSKMWWDQ